MQEIPTSNVRDDLRSVLEEVQFGEPVIITRHKKPVCIVLPLTLASWGLMAKDDLEKVRSLLMEALAPARKAQADQEKDMDGD